MVTSLLDHLALYSFVSSYLEDELVGFAQLAQVLVVLLVLLDLLIVGSVKQQLLDVSRLQPVGAHVHQDLAQLAGGELQMGDEDGCGSGGGEGWRSLKHRQENHCAAFGGA